MAFPRGGRLLELGNWVEALAELKNIPSQFAKHPQVLCLRNQIHVRAGHWEMAADLARILPVKTPTAFSQSPPPSRHAAPPEFPARDGSPSGRCCDEDLENIA